jgi:hypothetical protein
MPENRSPDNGGNCVVDHGFLGIIAAHTAGAAGIRRAVGVHLVVLGQRFVPRPFFDMAVAERADEALEPKSLCPCKSFCPGIQGCGKPQQLAGVLVLVRLGLRNLTVNVLKVVLGFLRSHGTEPAWASPVEMACRAYGLPHEMAVHDSQGLPTIPGEAGCASIRPCSRKTPGKRLVGLMPPSGLGNRTVTTCRTSSG